MAQAQDNGHPSLSGTVTVYINVIDLNDNAPIFDPMSFSNEILEDVPVGSPVVTISATDMDSGNFYYIFIVYRWKLVLYFNKELVKKRVIHLMVDGLCRQ